MKRIVQVAVSILGFLGVHLASGVAASDRNAVTQPTTVPSQISGTVVDSEGHPIADAQLELVHFASDGHGGYIKGPAMAEQVRSDATGQFRVAIDLAESSYANFRATAKGYAYTSITLMVREGRVEFMAYPGERQSGPPLITLLPEAFVSGQVLDETGKPVTGAEVRASSLPTTAKTDEHGRFRLDKVRPTNSARPMLVDMLIVKAPSYVQFSQSLEGIKAREEKVVQVSLEPGVEVSGTLRDADSHQPLAGSVTLVGRRPNALNSAITNAAGEYHLLVPAGTFSLVASVHPSVPEFRGYYLLQPRTTGVAEIGKPVVNCDIEFRKGRTVAGRVTAPEGADLKGIRISLKLIRERASKSAVTKPDGSFEFWNCKPGRYEVAIEGMPFNPMIKQAFLLAPLVVRDDADLRDVTLALTSRQIGCSFVDISGTILSEGGTPAAKASVTVESQPDEIGPNKPVPLLADERGNFILHRIDTEQPLEFSVRDASGEEGTLVVVADPAKASPITVTLARGATFTGVVRDEAGEPMRGCNVTIYRQTTRGGMPLRPKVSATTDKDGSYKLVGAVFPNADDRYEIFVSVPPSQQSLEQSGGCVPFPIKELKAGQVYGGYDFAVVSDRGRRHFRPVQQVKAGETK